MFSTKCYCRITIDESPEQFYPGDLVKGKVFYGVLKPLKIRGILLALEVREHTYWTYSTLVPYEYATYTEYRRETIDVHGHNQILRSSIVLKSEGDYEVGDYFYPFEFQLPDRLPSKFYGENGSINFYMVCTVDIPAIFTPNTTHEKEIPVESPIDLNKIPWLNPGPVSYIKSKTLRWFFSSLGTVTVEVYLEKAALVPGEETKVKVHLKNSSSEKIRAVEAKIVRFTKEYPNSKIRTPKSSEKILASFSEDGAMSHTERIYQFRLSIPRDIHVPNLYGSQLFKRWTELKVDVLFSGWHSNLTLTIPIKLGNIPFGREENQIQRAYSASSFDFLLQPQPDDEEHCQSDMVLKEPLGLEVPSTSAEVQMDSMPSSST